MDLGVVTQFGIGENKQRAAHPKIGRFTMNGLYNGRPTGVVL
jgi:hypothetical protein